MNWGAIAEADLQSPTEERILYVLITLHDSMDRDEFESLRAGDKLLKVVAGLNELQKAGVTELAGRIGLPASTTHFYLDILKENGFVVQIGEEYQLSMRFLEIGINVRRNTEIFSVARDRINELSKSIGEMSLLMAEESGRGVYLHKSVNNVSMDINAEIGVRRPLHDRALGKAILAYKSDEYVHEVANRHGLTKTTKYTITDIEELLEELDEIKNEGVAFNDQEATIGFRGVAVPILRNESVLGAISVAGPKDRLTGDKFRQEVPDELMEARNLIELELLYGE